MLSLQGMVEVVAENYHNIWAKKKKAELGSKGLQLYSNSSWLLLFVVICSVFNALSVPCFFLYNPLLCFFLATVVQSSKFAPFA